MNYVLVTANGTVITFFIVDAAKLYQQIYGGAITALNV